MRRGARGEGRGARGSLLVALMLLVVGCRGDALPAPSSGGADVPAVEPTQLVVASHDSFAVSEEVIQAFKQANNADVQFLTLADAGAALNKIILSKDSPLADVFFGVNNTFLSRALATDTFEPYASPLLAEIPAALQLDPSHRLLPVDYGFVNLNADQKWFADRGLPLPQTLEDLVFPAYKGLLVLPNPATSSPGLAFCSRPSPISAQSTTLTIGRSQGQRCVDHRWGARPISSASPWVPAARGIGRWW